MSHVFDPKDPALQPVRSRRRTLALVGLWIGVVIVFWAYIVSAIVSETVPLVGDGIRLVALAGLFLTRLGLRAKFVRPAPLRYEVRVAARGVQLGLVATAVGIIAALFVLNLSHRAGPWNLPGVIVLFLAYLAIAILGYRADLWRWREEHREQ
jgi:hypothetical protein